MIYLMIYLQARSPVAEMKELIAALLGVLALYIPVGKWPIRYSAKKWEKLLKSHECSENRS